MYAIRSYYEFSWSYSTAVGLFNSVINFTLLVLTNRISWATSFLWKCPKSVISLKKALNS